MPKSTSYNLNEEKREKIKRAVKIKKGKGLKMKKVEIKIEGMHCDGCSKRLTKVLSNIEGVNTVEVSLENKLADIKYDENIAKIEDFYEAIEDAGFEVVK